MNSSRGLLALVLGLALGMSLLAGCGGKGAAAGAHRPSQHADVVLSVRTVPKLGTFLVTHGWTLYMYPPDRRQAVTCTKVQDCETAWPPLFLRSGHKVVAGAGVKQSLISTTPGDGGQVVSYNGWPLYYYIGDRRADTINGQNQGFNWFVVDPTGTPIKTAYPAGQN